jgi:hypothetical protein
MRILRTALIVFGGLLMGLPSVFAKVRDRSPEWSGTRRVECFRRDGGSGEPGAD